MNQCWKQGQFQHSWQFIGLEDKLGQSRGTKSNQFLSSDTFKAISLGGVSLDKQRE